MSLAMASGASASTAGSAVDVPLQNTASHHELFLGEEEISDVSLSTFYVFDKENDAMPRVGEKVAWGCRCGCVAADSMAAGAVGEAAGAVTAAAAVAGVAAGDRRDCGASIDQR
jgi:hypothetical protein